MIYTVLEINDWTNILTRKPPLFILKKKPLKIILGLNYVILTNSMKESPSWEASSSAGQKYSLQFMKSRISLPSLLQAATVISN